MSSKYHKSIIRLIGEYGRTFNKVVKVKTSGYISINHPTKLRKVIGYNPDVRYILKTSEVIFEVVETQGKEKTIADVIRAFLAPNVSQVYFVVNDKIKYKEVDEIVDVILSVLSDKMGRKKKDLPLDVTIIPIEESKSDNKDEVFRECNQFC